MPDSKLQSYKVKTNVFVGGKHHRAGATVLLSEEHAAQAVEAGAIEREAEDDEERVPTEAEFLAHAKREYPNVVAHVRERIARRKSERLARAAENAEAEKSEGEGTDGTSTAPAGTPGAPPPPPAGESAPKGEKSKK
jgi:hypothetical protein